MSQQSAPLPRKRKAPEPDLEPATGEQEQVVVSCAAEPSFRAPDRYREFDEAPFPEPLQQALLAAGYKSPTPIQSMSWPLLLDGHDLIAVAKTGE